jgi:hypothetical protein
MATKKKTKKVVRKQSSAKLSTIAARCMRTIQMWEQCPTPKAVVYGKSTLIQIPVKNLKALCASVLAQDETKGQK